MWKITNVRVGLLENFTFKASRPGPSQGWTGKDMFYQIMETFFSSSLKCSSTKLTVKFVDMCICICCYNREQNQLPKAVTNNFLKQCVNIIQIKDQWNGMYTYYMNM